MGSPGAQDTSDNRHDSPQKVARIQIFCPLPRLPENLRPFLYRRDVQCSWVITYEASERYQLIEQFDLAVFCPGHLFDLEQKRKLGQLLQTAQQKGVPILLLTEDATLQNLVPVDNTQNLPRIQVAKPEITMDELWGRICSMLNFSPLFDRIETYMGRLEKWALSINTQFEELHQEVRLAWRVQQDFLPKKLPRSPRLRFGALYRPASWVSGDTYDLFQLDERHIGFYIADVVGHGVAAGLMTMFVKRALVTKEILGQSYRLLEPGQAMARLNADLCDMELPEQQFVTACYGLIDVQTCETTIARAGHPLPILIEGDGKLSRIESAGSLLGVFAEADFDQAKCRLAPGNKLVVFSDGLEQAFGESEGEAKMLEEVGKIAHLPADQMTDALSALLDCQACSLHPADDITAIVIECLPE